MTGYLGIEVEFWHFVNLTDEIRLNPKARAAKLQAHRRAIVAPKATQVDDLWFDLQRKSIPSDAVIPYSAISAPRRSWKPVERWPTGRQADGDCTDCGPLRVYPGLSASSPQILPRCSNYLLGAHGAAKR